MQLFQLKIRNAIPFLLIVFIAILNNAKAQVPTITSFSPLSAIPGTVVTLTGTNFNTTAANNIVFFGATMATVTASTATSITATVPVGATHAPITVLDTTTNLAAYSLANFNPIYSPAKTSITATDFLPKQDFATGANPHSVAIGDIDGDGKPDLAVANLNGNSVSVYRNTSISGSIGTGSFAFRGSYSTGTAPQSVTIGDVDGDGKPDLVIANQISNTVSIHRNLTTIGIFGFAVRINFTTGTNPHSVAIGDIDGDGKLDLAVANSASNNVSVLRNTATSGSITSSSFAAKIDFATGSAPYSVAIGDIDGDGKPDLAVANFGSANVSIFSNTSTSGSIGFATKQDFATGTNPYSVAIGDIDGDGKLDLAVANSGIGANTVSVLRNSSTSGNIGFATKQDFTTGTRPLAVTIGDIDGDGKPDLAVGNVDSDNVSVLRNTSTSGSIGFASKVDFTTGDRPYSVAIGDIDGDGKPDLAVANYGSTTVSVLRNADIPIPTISSFSPLSAKPNDVVTITGTNFNTTPANNIVFFGATRATVTASTATSITTTVPIGATHAPITVLNTETDLAAYSLANFNPIYSPAKTGITANDFLSKQDFTTGTNPYSVAIGDIDGDGKPDLAVANFGSNTVSVYRNTATHGSIGAGSFATKIDSATGSNPRTVAIGDIDGDGKPDLVVTNQGSNTVSIYRNTSTIGSIGFAARVDFATGTTPVSVAIGDIDGDGKHDLVVTNYGSNTVSVLRNTSSSSSIGFAASVDFTTGTNPHSVVIGDIDGDDKPDLAVVNNGSDNVSVLRNTSTSGSIVSVSFAAKVDFATGTDPYSVAIGDIDGDGKLDLAVANNGSGVHTVSVLRNTSTSGSIGFATKQDFTTGTRPIAVTIGDLDGDGKPDLAVSNHGSANVSVLRNTSTSGSIGLATRVNFTTSTQPIYVVIGDIDGDSKPDLAVTNLGTDNLSVLRNADIPPPTITSFSPLSAIPGNAVTITGTNFNTSPANNIVFFGATRATVTASTATSITVTVPVGATHAPITVLNTATDLAAYSLSNFNPIYSPAKTSITATDFLPKQDFTTGADPYSVAIGDIDGDGKPDLAVANHGSANVSVLRNTSTSGSIGFATKQDFTTGTSPIAVTIGDLDGDGKPDLVVTNQGSSTVSVLRNTSTSGSIGFAGKQDFTTGTRPVAVTIGDIDGDGKPDLAVSNANSNTVSVLRNTSSSGSIGFASKVDFTTEDFPASVAIGDIDGDGKPDLAVSNINSNKVSVLRNTSSSGSIGFATKQDFTTGSNPRTVAIGDIDGDNKPDLVIANSNSNNVSVLCNTSTSGSIGFAGKQDFTTGTRPIGVTIGDIDGDGKPDLAVSNINSNTVSVLRNTSSSSSIGFASKVDFTAEDFPASVAIGDIDGDGKPDLAVANYSSNTVSVFRNADITTWDGSTWSNGTPSSTVDAIIASTTAPASFTCKNLTINSTFALTTTGIIATVNGNIVNNGNGIAGTGGLTIAANSTISGTAINFNGVLTVNSGATLTTGGFLTLTSNATNTARIANSAGTISGNVTVQRFIPAKATRRFSFITSPISQVLSSAWQQQIHITGAGTGGVICPGTTKHTNGFDATVTNAPSMFSYNASNAAGSRWLANTTGTTGFTLTPGTGYRLSVRGARSIGCSLLDGTPSGLIPTAVTLSASGFINNASKNAGSFTNTYNNNLAGNWVLIGNPYPSEIDFNALTSLNNTVIGTSYIVYDPQNAPDAVTPANMYSTWNAGTWSNAPTSISNANGQFIANGQAFFVQAINASNITLSFAESIKYSGTQNGVFRTASTWNDIIRVGLKKDAVDIDQTVVRYTNTANVNNNRLGDLDATLLSSSNSYLGTLKAGSLTSIQTRSLQQIQSDSVQLDFNVSQTGNYSFNFSEHDNFATADIYLLDNYNKTTTGIKANPVYNFSVDKAIAATQANRFVLVFNKTIVPVVAVIKGVKMYPNPANKQVTIELPIIEGKYTVKITDVAGKQVYQNQLAAGVQAINISQLSQGNYVVEITDTKGNRNVEKLVKQ